MDEPRTPQHLQDEESAFLDELDHARLARVDRSLARAHALKTWWEGRFAKWINEYDGNKLAAIVTTETHPHCFPLARAIPVGGNTEANYGFFDRAPIDGELKPVMGLVQQTLFDQPKAHFVKKAPSREQALKDWRDGLRAFVLHHLIRLTGLYEIAPYVDPRARPIEPWLRPISWCQSGEDRRSGFSFSQVYYKRTKTGRVGKFRDADRARLDTSTLGATYEWIVVGIKIHDLHLRHPAFDRLSFPISDEVFAIMSPELVVDEPAAGRRPSGIFGFGYASLEDPPPQGTGLVWQRPAFGFQLNLFVVQDDGRILARVTTLTDKLTWLLGVNPWEFARRLDDQFSFGVFGQALNAGAGLIDRVMPGLVAETMGPIRQLMNGAPSGVIQPFSAFLRMIDSVPYDFGAKQLCMSEDEVVRSLLSDLVRSQHSTIVGSRGLWRAVPNWADERALPDWVRA